MRNIRLKISGEIWGAYSHEKDTMRITKREALAVTLSLMLVSLETWFLAQGGPMAVYKSPISRKKFC